MDEDKRIKDLLGNVLFIGAHVVTCIAGDQIKLRHGTIISFNEKNFKFLIGGGNCGKEIWRYSQELILLPYPEEK